VTSAGEEGAASELQEQQQALELLQRLWPEPRTWQPRLVYRVSLSTTTHARVEARYHLVIPPDLLDDAGVAVSDTPAACFFP
jgi:hypothetical protein